MSHPDPSYDSNDQLEHDLERGPDAIAHAKIEWRKATHERSKQEALLFARLKGEAEARGEQLNATELKHLINLDDELFKYKLAEITCEAEYERVYEKHLANKRRASLRTAF